jgi:hypothetical protein
VPVGDALETFTAVTVPVDGGVDGDVGLDEELPHAMLAITAAMATTDNRVIRLISGPPADEQFKMNARGCTYVCAACASSD